MSDSSVILEILKHPNENGIVIFVLGVLFVLSVYHFLLYFQHKDKAYLYYSIYTALIFIGHLYNSKNGFISILIEPFHKALFSIDIYLTWVYNMLYFIFAFTFLDLKSYSIKWYNFIFKAIYLLCFICILFGFIHVFTGKHTFAGINGHFFFMGYLTILGIISFIPLFKINSPLKYYIIIGSILLFGSSVVANIIHHLNLNSEGSQINYSIFYIGVILENILFSLALGHKQKLILNEKKASQEKLIVQLQENEKLQLKIQEKLEQDLALLSKQAEIEKLEASKSKSDKELSELKMASLRSQMNPHFIFNSLNSIKLYIINNEKENAVYYLNKFSKLIRKILTTTREKEISLAEEIETMELYTNIENIRFNNEIDFSFIIDEKLPLNTIKIPGLILQPFIENAIWHGLSSKKGHRKLDVIVKNHKQSHIKITISDNGIGRKKSAEMNNAKIHKKESVGLKITAERLQNFTKNYQNKYVLKFTDLYNEDDTVKGTRVVLIIPLK